jgi:V/A-type H+-transporting ATPase subunit I
MKKITVVSLGEHREETIEGLREVGTVHVVDVRQPASAELDQLLRRREHLERALKVLEIRAAGTKKHHPDLDADQAAAKILGVVAELDRVEERLGGLAKMAEALEPWGSFSGEDLGRIRESGLQVKLGVAAPDKLPTLPEGASLQEISRHKGQVYFALVAPAGVTLEFEETALPEITDMAEIRTQTGEAHRRIGELETELTQLRGAMGALETGIRQLDDDIAFRRVRDGMGASERLAYLQGYVPVKRLEELRQAAAAQGWGLMIEDPEEGDPKVPTLVTLPKWIEPIRIVFQGLGIMPGYHEVDISACFLFFFSIFFALLIGDAGYGAIFLVLTLAARMKFSKAPAPPFWLFGILSVATIVWGVLTGTYFGLAHEHISVLAKFPSVAFLNDANNVQQLCFLIGAIHLTIAHIWNAVVIGRTWKALSELSWAAVLWGNYFLALQLVLNKPASPAMMPLYGIGFAGIVLFSAPQKNPLKVLGAGVGALLMGVINSFVDVVSYVRLFAVGAASVKVASSFNEMAGGLGQSWWAPLAAALVLLMGHGLNIMLGAMGVLVHGIRLNVLEFAGHVGLQFTGRAYQPLKRSVEVKNS